MFVEYREGASARSRGSMRGTQCCLLFFSELNKEKGDNLLNNCKYNYSIEKVQRHGAIGSVFTRFLCF